MTRRRVAVARASYSSEHADVVDLAEAPDEVSGADVVVVAGADSDRWGEIVRDRAPNAVVVVVGGSPHLMCETTLFPRARVIGVATDAEAAPVVDAIVLDREQEFETVVRCVGERGIEDDFVRVPVRIAGRGVVEIVE